MELKASLGQKLLAQGMMDCCKPAFSPPNLEKDIPLLLMTPCPWSLCPGFSQISHLEGLVPSVC